MTINEIFKELKTALLESAPSLSTVTRWFNKFKSGVEDLKDKLRKGRPITEVTQASIEKVRVVIENDPWCLYNEIEAETALSHGTIYIIIHAHLNMRKLVSRWVPHELTEKNRRDRVSTIWENLCLYDTRKSFQI